MKNNNLQFGLFLLFYACLLIFDKCGNKTSLNTNYVPKIDTIIRIDTILPPPVIVQLPRQVVPKPTIIYIDSSKNIVLNSAVDTNRHFVANSYQDSLSDENLTIYYSSIVEGALLQNHLDYKLKIPKEITKTIEITKPVLIPSNAIYLTSSFGANTNGFSSARLGTTFISAKGWSLGYDYDLLQNMHSIHLGVRLFKFK